ncbi:MAG: polyprenyl synthetase family protein [Nitrospirota bacterium]|nr:MAG: polyprenyl synthetase family protein [Nitrospirota bacterium]
MSLATSHAPIHTPELISDMLQEYGAMTYEAIKQYLPTGMPRQHLYDLVSDYPERGGKMMRSTICLATARAFGSRLEDALLSAVAIELLHNALLIHDDIEDGSEERRGRPTLHKLHGIPLALNAGDTLSLLSLRPLMDNIQRIGSGLAMRIFKETERVAWESAEGQAMELGWCRDNCNDLKDADYLLMVLKKTCWLATIHPCRVGALIGTRGQIALDPFIRFGFFVGAAFQIQDDLLNLVADARYGKELNGDIWEGKRTLMLIHAYQQANPGERQRLAETMALSRDQRTAKQVFWVRQLMDRYGAVDHARRIAHGLAGAALKEYSAIYDGLPDSRDKQFIQGLPTWVFERN